MTKTFIASIGVAILLTGGPAVAIIVRDDVPDGRYLALGDQYRSTFVDIAVPRRSGVIGPGNGGGTLVAPRWVVTAAHVAAGIKPGHPESRVTGEHSVLVDGKPYAVAEIFLNPDWLGGPGTGDIALIHLAVPVIGGKPACLYPSNDEGGQRAILVGSGDSGTGLTGPLPGPNVLRGATVSIDRESPEPSVLSWTFRKPSDTGVTALEGISGPGDSGGPAFIEHKGSSCLAGVSSAGDGMGRGPGRYGGREYYSRVSYYLGWLERVMKEHP